jgi:hypothetical protein
MKSFKSYITEEKLTHLEHVEDAIFDFGVAGAKEALKILGDVAHSLEGHSKRAVNIQAKVDGAPAVIAGIDPESGKFFVGTKALFNKTPKINYTNADVDRNHAGGLADKLKAALKHFPKMKLKGIYQGDFMFTPDDLKKETIDGEKYITFTPNTITYAVPLDSDLAKTIIKSKVGVIWHTTYTGDTIADLKANFKININQFTKQKDVWFTDTNFRDASGTATLTASEMKKIKSKLASATKELGKLDTKSMGKLFGKTELSKLVKVYINSQVRKGEQFDNKQKAVGTFIDFVTADYQKKMDKLKSQKGKDKKQLQLDSFIKELRSGKLAGTFAHTLEWHNTVIDIKMMIVKKLEKVNQIPAFVKTDTGYKVTGPEGFVAIDTLSNSAVKLVNRMEFSRNNFNIAKSWS